jgi:uncharacterized membrane protein YphA (DoxX/SURF4 family)
MNTTLWIVQGMLAAVFLASGTMMLTQPHAWLIEKLGTWVEHTPAGLVKLLGALEVLAAIGLIVPKAAGILPVLTPLAACGVVVVMIGAIIIHARENEYLEVVLNVVLGAGAVIVTWGWFGS